jgi:hypothetical protein
LPTVLLIAGFFLLTAWIILSTVKRVARRDWVLASSMLVPLPLFGVWVVKLQEISAGLPGIAEQMSRWDRSLAVILLLLGVSSALSSRCRQRGIKALLLFLTSTFTSIVFAYIIWDDLRIWGIVGLICLLSAIYASPIAFTIRRSRRIREDEGWWEHVSSREQSQVS